MSRYFLLIVTTLLLTVLLLPASSIQLHAQEDEPVQPRPAQELLAWGAEVLPYPEWLFQVQEQPEQVTSQWTRSSDGAIIAHNHRLGVLQYTGEEINEFVDDAWLGSALDSYDGWIGTGRCTIDSTLVVDVEAELDETTYAIRYWLFTTDNDAFASVTAIFPVEKIDELDSLATELLPDVASCAAARQDGGENPE